MRYVTLSALLASVLLLLAATTARPVEAQDGMAGLMASPLMYTFRCLLLSSKDPLCTQDKVNRLSLQSAQSSFAGTATSIDDGELHQDVDVSLQRHHKNGWIYLIRHGEKVKKSEKTGLSERGLRRARCLRNVFGDNGDKIDFILAQDYKPNGKRKRPYETVRPLAQALGIPLDHNCDRDDTRCVANKIQEKAHNAGQNVLVVWEHARLTNIAKAIGVRGLQYPDDRYDVVFKIRKGKVHAIYSEECNGLDERWFHWRGTKKGKHGKGGKGGRLVDDESWADPDDEGW